MLARQKIDFYHQNGYLHLPGVFTPDETRDLQDDMDWMVQQWATTSPGWSGPWRQALMDEQTEEQSKLIHMHKLHYYCASWMRATVHPPLIEALAQLLGDCVELHNTTMHVKPPQTGHPFPMHQDHPFYPHADDRYVDVLVHLDDTCHENGEIRFLAGSHKAGPLPHITEFDDGTTCTPHLPTDQYKLADTVAVPAKAGDCVLFNINTIHGSYINQTNVPRRMVRIGYRHPDNEQFAGDSFARPDVIVHGRRRRLDGQPQFSVDAPQGDIDSHRARTNASA